METGPINVLMVIFLSLSFSPRREFSFNLSRMRARKVDFRAFNLDSLLAGKLYVTVPSWCRLSCNLKVNFISFLFRVIRTPQRILNFPLRMRDEMLCKNIN